MTIIVVPCYNEADRLDGPAFLSLARAEKISKVLFVNDGSTDQTAATLSDLGGQCQEKIETLILDHNEGKAEAVRRGLLRAIDLGSGVVGYLDADLATPVPEFLRLLDILQERNASVVLASRVALLGRTIDRRPLRHYLGRLFATAASLALQLTVYDTQCGAKLFRVSPGLRAALEDRFLSRWAFDVELIGRLIAFWEKERSAPGVVLEEPLQSWHDRKGSKMTARQGAQAFFDIVRIGKDLSRRRKTSSARSS